jgi:radical SAM superfamily enzyme YgiQ (UPF0313 family)
MSRRKLLTSKQTAEDCALPTTGVKEFNSILKDTRNVDVLFGYAYPSTYRAGMTGLATHLFYSILNDREDTSCERYFRYDVASPCHSVESGRPLKENHIVGFSLTYEEDIINLLQMLDRGNIPVVAAQRSETDPIVLVGGPVPSANPEPYADFVDAFVIGEGDLVISQIVDAAASLASRSEIVTELAGIEGVYVPAAGQSEVRRLRINQLDSLHHPTAQILPDVPEGSILEPVFGRSLLVETTRGCGYSCKFCLVGHICRPKRARSLERLKEIISKGIEETPVHKVALIASSLGDIDGLGDLASWIVDRGIGLSVPSLRADSVSGELLSILVRGGQKTFTIAPETGSQQLRRSAGKTLSDEEIENTVQLAAKAGFAALKLYFMIGLPGETDDDVRTIPTMVERLVKMSGMRVTVSLNPFIPKAHTEWERETQSSIESIRAKIRMVERGLRGATRVEFETLDPRSARIQAALSIGNRSLGKAILVAARYGGYGGWRRAEKEAGVPVLSVASETRRLEGNLPWDFIKNR